MSKTLRKYKVITEDSAEGVQWKGKYYSYWKPDVKAIPFFFMNDGSVIAGSMEDNQTHETAMLLYCYQLLGEEVPLNDEGKPYYIQMYDDIEIGHSKLFNHLTDNIKVQGRVFFTDDGNCIFSCYEILEDDDAKEMMAKVALKLRLPREKCYYEGHYHKKVVPLITRITEGHIRLIVKEILKQILC